jgi:alpha-beta hydrolase superfamily lysophospholipase
MGIPSSKTSWSGTTVNIEIKAIGAFFYGKLNAEGNKLEGNWMQSGGTFPLVLEPFTETIPAKIVLKPQTPQPPFSYLSKDYIYEGSETKLTYGATLTYPNESSTFPVLILITGSGKQDRDETILDHKPFYVLADFLTKNGYAVLRVDDRGIGKSSGDFQQSTSADFALDVAEHIRFVKSLPMINQKKIGLLGHSEGGLIAPLVAAENSSVSFLVLLAGPGIPIIDLMGQQNEAILTSVGMPQTAIDTYIPLYKNLLKTLSREQDLQQGIQQAKEITLDWFNASDKEMVKVTTGIQTPDEIDAFVKNMSKELSSKWWQFFANYLPARALQKVKCPVLAINGGSDIQVLADANLNGIEKELAKAGNKRVTIKKFEGLNHLFQKCNMCTVAEYGELETTIEPEVLAFLLAWLKMEKI